MHGNEAFHVLKNEDTRLVEFNEPDHSAPVLAATTGFFFAFPLACRGKWLAWKPCHVDVDTGGDVDRAGRNVGKSLTDGLLARMVVRANLS